MKRLLLTLAMLPPLAFAGPSDIVTSQRNTTDTGSIPRTVAKPPGTADGLMGFSGATQLPVHWTLGPGLIVTGGALDTVPGGAPAWASITGKPTTIAAYGITDAFNGSYAALTGVPTTFTPTAHTHAAADIVSGTLAVGRIPALSISQTTGLESALDGKYTVPTGTTTQYVRGDGSLATLPAPGVGTVTSVTAGTGLSGGVITGSGTVSMPATGTAGTYNTVTTDAQGRVAAGTALSINDAPARTLVTTATATGYQVSASRVSHVCYEGSLSTTSTIGGPSAATVFLETADTNSTTAGDWTVKAQQTYSNNITLAIVLNQVQGNNWSLCRYISAGKYVRVRVGGVTGTASASINATQQEVLY